MDSDLIMASVAFDTVDQYRLEKWVGFSGTVLGWSNLKGRGYIVTVGDNNSEWISMTCGVPQGLSLGPLLCNLCILSLGQIMQDDRIFIIATTPRFT